LEVDQLKQILDEKMDKKTLEDIINRFKDSDAKNSNEDEKSDLILEKRISPSERERNWIHASSIKEQLPETRENFKLKVRDEENKVIETYLDSYDRIRIGSRGFWELGMKTKKAKKIKIYKTQEKDLFEIQVIKEP